MNRLYQTPSGLPLPPSARYCAVVHYAEVGLKGGNRGQFENQLRRNILRALSDTTVGSVQRYFGRLMVFFPKQFDWPAICERLSRVFGIAYFSLGILTDQNLDNIIAAALAQVSEYQFNTFRVTARRSQKDFALTSQEINIRVGAAIQEKTGTAVNLDNPELECRVEIFNLNAAVYVEKLPGQGGLPTGVSEKAVSLLSSGIDSPVASWKIMRRGVRLTFVHFHSMPATSPASIENARSLVQLLTTYQYEARLYLVPFLAVQQKIMVESVPDYRVLLYRRSMFQMAEMIAKREKATALVSGESVGQVASQTLSNIRVVNEATELPVLRPLAGDDKKDIIEIAKEIGTFTISSQPYQDCCSLYVPRHPETRANPEKIRAAESVLNLQKLLTDAVNKAEIVKFRHPQGQSNKNDLQ